MTTNDALVERLARLIHLRDFEGDQRAADAVWDEGLDYYCDSYRDTARRWLKDLELVASLAQMDTTKLHTC